MKQKKSLWIVSLLLAIVMGLAAGCSLIAKDSFKVSFDSNGGTAIESVEILDGATVTKPTDPTKEGYTFVGWYLGEEEFSFEQKIEETITLTAKWAPNTDTAYTVKHFQETLEGGYEEVVADVENMQGTTDASTEAVAKNYVGFTAQEVVQQSIAPDGSTVVEIKYDRNTIVITWVVDGVSTQENYKFGEMPAHADPVKNANETYTYAFSGWDSTLAVVSEEKTYTAIFTPTYINYSVVFKGEDGSVISQKDDYHYGDTIVAPAAPVKEADLVYFYTFNGWNNAETVTGNLEYQASFTEQYVNYSVVFKGVNGEEINRKDDYHYGDTVVVPAHSENLAGYTYGWDKEVVAVAGDATYTETKTPNTYSVTLMANGGELAAELTSYVYGVGAVLPTATKVGYDFKGWYTSNEFSGEAVTEITATDLDAKTFYAKWEAKTYNVTLVPGEGCEVETELVSYVYGVGAVLPNANKKGYTLEGWYENSDFSGNAVVEITATDLGDKTFYAKYTPNKDTKYSVQVLVPQYASIYNAGYYYPGAVTYVDRTSEYATFFGLDENNKAQGETDSTVDLTALINTLQGAKLNDESVVIGVINADETLELSVVLDVDEQELGFSLSNIRLGQYSWENLVFTLAYMDEVCGLAITGDLTAGAKDLIISIDPANVTQYAEYSLVYYEKGASTQNKFAVNGIVSESGVSFVKAASEEYVRYSLNVGSLFPNEKVVNQLRVGLYERGTKNVFIKGIEKVEYVKETVTYNIENGNLINIVKPLGTGVISQVANHTFANTNENINLNAPALLYTMTSETPVVGYNATGVVIDLGGIRVSDYKVIRITFQTIATEGGTNVFANNTELTCPYGGAHIVDIKALAESKGVTSFAKLELSMSSWAKITKCQMYIASIELVVDENAPAVPEVTYNVNFMLDGGELETELNSYVYGVGATLPQAVKENHTFLGWYTNKDYTGEAVTEIGANEFGIKTFYAKFQSNFYNVVLELDGGAVETELTSYLSGVGAVLPNATKKGYTFDGWYVNSDFSGEAVTEIGAEEVGDKTFYAKFTPNESAEYSIQVLVAQYGQGYTSPYYHPGTLTYVDRTSEYASIFGLGETNVLVGATGSTIDLSEKVAMLKGAKVNAESVLSGVVAVDGSLQLIVKLDFDEEALGFKLADVSLGRWSCDGLTFTLKYHDGVCGLAIDGTIGNGKELLIAVDGINTNDYLSLALNYYEKSATTNTLITVSSEVVGAEVLKNHVSLIPATTNPEDYIKVSKDLISTFSTIATIKQFSLKFGAGGEKHIFISGIEGVKAKKETVTYSIENGNLMDIVTPINAGTVSQVANHTFANNSENEKINFNSPALVYVYEGDAVSGAHTTGVIIDLSSIRLSDYKTVKITFQTIVNAGGTNVFVNDVELTCPYGGAHIVDVKALAEAKGIECIDKFELSTSSWANVTSCKIYIASIELVLNDAE